jgi:hypothetical protein
MEEAAMDALVFIAGADAMSVREAVSSG